MREMNERAKPSGELGSLQAGRAFANYQRKKWPAHKAEIEKAVMDIALKVAKASGVTLYDVTQEPQQNATDDYDFTIQTTRGTEYVELTEVNLGLEKSRGYNALPTSFKVGEMVAGNLKNILKKSQHYPKTMRIHLLLYSTDWRLGLRQEVIDALAAAVAKEKHTFSTICYLLADNKGGGVLRRIHPQETPFQVANRSSYVAFADIRSPALSGEDAIVPMPLPTDEGTASNLMSAVSNHEATSNSQVRFRVDSHDGNQSLTIPPGATGCFTDTTHTDSVGTEAADTDVKIETPGGAPNKAAIVLKDTSVLFTPGRS